MKDGYKKIGKKHRLDYWIGIGSGTLSSAVLSTLFGYLISDYLNNNMMIALAIVNPVYFLCMMIGAMKNIKTTIAIVIGIILGPLFYLTIPEWSILIAGFIGGTAAFLMKGKNNDI
jgi:predicted branched-subunit amino acid permease